MPPSCLLTYLGHADLLGHLDNLNLDIDLDERLRERVDLDETRVHSSCETSEFGDETDISLGDGLVWVGADDAARNRSQVTDDGAERVDHASVPAWTVVSTLAAMRSALMSAYHAEKHPRCRA